MPNLYSFPVRGVYYRGQEAKQALDRYFEVSLDPDHEWDIFLEPEPTNKHDPNAIKVLLKRADETASTHIGYIGREHCELCKHILSTETILDARIDDNLTLILQTEDKEPTT